MAAPVDFVLRPVVSEDASQIAGLIGDWEVVRWLSTPPYPYSVGDAVEFLRELPTMQSGDRRFDAIVIDGRVAGTISIGLRRRGMELAYWLGRPYWGRRIISLAAAAATSDFFANSSETRLNSGYFSGNERSEAVQVRLGFEISGEGLLFNRPHGKRLPHFETTLTRARFEARQSGRDAQRPKS